jgi:hypothetical protein
MSIIKVPIPRNVCLVDTSRISFGHVSGTSVAAMLIYVHIELALGRCHHRLRGVN